MIRGVATRLGWVGRAGLLAVLVASGGDAQVPAEPRLEGVVERGTAGPVAEATVLLHRIDPTAAGEIDSVRTDQGGRFAFELPTVPDPGGRDEIYFASVRHQGVVYFGGAVSQAVQLDSVYRIQVFDTAVAPPEGAPVPLGVRYLLAEPVEGGWQVTDLMQIDVTGERTWVNAEGGVTWRYPMPEGLADVQLGGGDVPAEGTVLRDGVVEISSALSPGARQLVSRYRLDSLALTVPLPGGVREMEILVQEPAPELEVTGLARAENVELDGVGYRRWTGTDLLGTVVQVRPGTAPSGRWLSLPWLSVLLGLGLAGVGIYAVRRGRDPTPAPVVAGGSPAERRNRLLVEIARIDEALESAAAAEAARLESRRAELVARLRETD